MFIENRQKISKGFDAQIIIYYIILITVGWMAIFSSCHDPEATVNIFNPSMAYGKQLIFIGTSILIAIGILLIDNRIYQNYAYHIYILFLVLMISVLVIGSEISGAKAWIKIGNFTIQPSEFMKLATALTLAKFFNEGKTSRERQNIWLLAFAIILIPVFIVFLQRDTGSALVFFSFIILFYREGMSAKILLIGAFAVFLFVFTLYFNEIYTLALLTTIFIIAWILNKKEKKKLIRNAIIYGCCVLFVFLVNIAYDHVFQPHQKQRIESLLGKTSDPKGADFNLNQSKIAIGSGGFTGKGYLNGTQTKFNFVPEQSTDFIFCSIGEEWGFLGTLFVMTIFMAMLIRIILLSERHRNPFVRFYGYGIAGIIFFHFAINIGMTIGLLPIIGIPLPFISYGGSSLWSFTSMLFIFIKLNAG